MKNNAIKLGILLFCQSAAVAGVTETGQILFFNREGQAPRGAWVSGASGGVAARETDPHRIVMTLRGRGEQAWLSFHDHMPLNVAELDLDETFRLRLRIRAAESFDGALQWGWIGPAERGSPRSFSRMTPLKIKPGDWSDVLLPAASAPAGGIAIRMYFEVDRPAKLEIEHLALESTRRVTLQDLPGGLLLESDRVTLSGTAAAGIAPEDALRVRDGIIETSEGRRVGLWGVNLFQSHLHWSRRQNPEDYRAELSKIAAAGFNAVRMPLNMSYFVPARGVYPDDPRYDEILRSHGLPTGAMAFYDGLIEAAGRVGLYVIPEFHELPSNPYRWFVGGIEADRGTGKPGTAISWMTVEGEDGRHGLNNDLAMTEIPKALGWLANHWRDVPNIAGIEVPWNEPLGPLTEPEPFFDLVQACADAIKAADPHRLVFLCTVDWGAMVNSMPDESLWKLPENVDVLFPHFYPGLHSNDSGEAGTWSTTMASWAAWLAGAGLPVMVGEYGVVEMHRGQYWKDSISASRKAATYSACAAQWHAQGLQGLFAWAWQGGLELDDNTGRLTNGAHVLPLWAESWRNMDRTPLAKARIAVVCTRSRRAAYGARRDLWRVSDALLDAHITPFAAIFDTQIAADPTVLQRFDALIAITTDLPEDVLETVRAAGKPLHELDAELSGLDETVKSLRALPGVEVATQPSNILLARGASQTTLFERKGNEGSVTIHAAPSGAKGSGRLLADDGRVIFAGDAAAIPLSGYTLPIAPWQTLRLTWQPEE